MLLTLGTAIASSVGPMLAKKGLGMLSNVLTGVVDKGTQKIAEKIEEETGIDMADMLNPATPEPTIEELQRLKEFELANEQMILDYVNEQAERDLAETEMVLEDKQSARTMFEVSGGNLQSDIANKIFQQSSWMIPALIISNIVSIVIAEYYKVSPGIAAGINTALGLALGRAWDERKTVLEFLFGSSKSENDYKDQSIAKTKSQLKGVIQ